MKKLLLLVILFIILNCKYSKLFYDIDPPEILFTSFIDNSNFLIQFNEPIKYLEIYTNKKNLLLNNTFPKANIFLNSDLLEKYQKNDILIKTTDTSNNSKEIKILNIFNNPDPAILSINEIRLKYTKKVDQMISFKVEKDGNLAGIQLNILNKNNKKIVTFENCQVKKNEILKINFIYNKEMKNSNESINFSKNRVIDFVHNKRLSQSNSLILITDYKNTLLDYILYYDSKKKDINELKNNKTFNQYISILKKYNIEKPIYTDIQGNTSKKTILKSQNRYIVKN